jgi:hypothetical protein
VVSIWINGQQREEVDESWIARTIEGLRRDGESVCVRLRVKTTGVDLRLTAGACPGEGGGRQPNPRELALIKIWNRCGLSGAATFGPGQLIHCIKELLRAA